jgi:DNA modification methylase
VPAARLPTNTTANRHAVHRWFNFIAGFSPEYVELCCKSSDSLLLDPFAGCGTALVEARSLALRAIGYEPHPFFARIARAKTTVSTDAHVSAIQDALLAGVCRPVSSATLSESAGAFLVKLFDRVALESLLGARSELELRGLAHDDLAFLVLSRVLDHCSKAQTDGIYKAPTSTKRALDPSDAIGRVVGIVRNDLVPDQAPSATSDVFESSSESMPEVAANTVDIIVTSPPYLNNFDFAEMTRMYLYFWGMCHSWGDISERVRSRLVVNTTTSLKGHRDRQEEYRRELAPTVRRELDLVVAALRAERRRRAGKKEYDLLVYPYFAQVRRVIAECHRVLRRGGRIHMAVADAALYGVHISTPQVLARIATEVGFRDVSCTKFRERGERWVLSKRDGSPIGLGEYQMTAIR